MEFSSLEVLLEAAKIVEERERDAANIFRRKEAGVGGSKQLTNGRMRRENKRSYTYRTTHNQLEKNRRAQLKNLLDDLRGQVPAKEDSKLTTLSLLTAAKSYIKELEMQEGKRVRAKDELIRANRSLKRQLLEMGGHWAPPQQKFKPVSHPVTKVMKLQVVDSESDVDVEDCSDDISSDGSDGATVNSK
eukprot:m.3336 g.3336  ORF g.3336 m.3336 type:complete len:189 (+) comp9278_c0_seq1:105-671(+)